MTEDFIYRIHIFKKGGMGGDAKQIFVIDLNVFTLDYVKKNHIMLLNLFSRIQVEVNLIYSGCVDMSVRWCHLSHCRCKKSSIVGVGSSYDRTKNILFTSKLFTLQKWPSKHFVEAQICVKMFLEHFTDVRCLVYYSCCTGELREP